MSNRNPWYDSDTRRQSAPATTIAAEAEAEAQRNRHITTVAETLLFLAVRQIALEDIEALVPVPTSRETQIALRDRMTSLVKGKAPSYPAFLDAADGIAHVELRRAEL